MSNLRDYFQISIIISLVYLFFKYSIFIYFFEDKFIVNLLLIFFLICLLAQLIIQLLKDIKNILLGRKQINLSRKYRSVKKFYPKRLKPKHLINAKNIENVYNYGKSFTFFLLKFCKYSFIVSYFYCQNPYFS